MLIADEETRAYLRRQGADPDDVQSVLAARLSPAGLALALIEIDAAQLSPADTQRIRDLTTHRSTDVQCDALDLLARAVGRDVIHDCRRLIDDRRFRYKASALHGICAYGDAADSATVVRHATSHVTGRRRTWAGASPPVMAIRFLERIDPDGDPLHDFATWLVRRWGTLSSGEQGHLADYCPRRAGHTAHITITSTDSNVASGAQSLAQRAMPTFNWRAAHAPDVADALVALDAASYRTCLRAPRATPVVRMPAPDVNAAWDRAWMSRLGTELSSLAYLADE